MEGKEGVSDWFRSIRKRRKLTDCDVLFDVEVTGVKERPKLATIGLGEDLGPKLSKDEGDDLEKELRDENGLGLGEEGSERPESEDSARTEGLKHRGVGCRERSLT